MKITIHLFDEQDIKGENAGFSLGWLEIKNRAQEITFFRNNLCMILLTTSSLMDGLYQLKNNNVRKYQWVGEGYGAAFELSLKEDWIYFENRNSSVRFKYKLFAQALEVSVREFLTKYQSINQARLNDAAVQDFYSSFHEWKAL